MHEDGSSRALRLADAIVQGHPRIESVTSQEVDGDVRITVNLLPDATDGDARDIWCRVLLPLEAILDWLIEVSVEPSEDLDVEDGSIELVYWPRPDTCDPGHPPSPLVGETSDGELVLEPRLVPRPEGR